MKQKGLIFFFYWRTNRICKSFSSINRCDISISSQSPPPPKVYFATLLSFRNPPRVQVIASSLNKTTLVSHLYNTESSLEVPSQTKFNRETDFEPHKPNWTKNFLLRREGFGTTHTWKYKNHTKKYNICNTHNFKNNRLHRVTTMIFMNQINTITLLEVV